MISLLNLNPLRVSGHVDSGAAMFRPTSTFSSSLLTVCGSAGLENRKYTSSAVLLYIFWILVRQWFSPRCRAAGAVLCLWTLALQTGSITQVALSMLTQVLSCRWTATQKPLRTLSKLHSGTSVSATAVSCYCSHFINDPAHYLQASDISCTITAISTFVSLSCFYIIYKYISQF